MQRFISEFLNFVEQSEARLLSWGFYDVCFEVEELETLFEADASPELKEQWGRFRNQWPNFSSLCDDLAYAGLLHRPDPTSDVFRSRFAEGVRLLARLRQMFQPKDWATGPNLVSDVKLHLESRRYPKRDRSPSECWADLKPVCTKVKLQEAAFRALSADSEGRQYDGFAGFQRRAFEHILQQYSGKGVSGSVISAGTGSGKTKAFYIPAFLGAITELHCETKFTKIIAIYPRNVLLADQLREALSEAEKLRPILAKSGLRALTFGALLGDTPYKNWFKSAGGGKYPREKFGWKRVDNGYIVPFLKSPKAPDQELVWRDNDRLAGRTCLYRFSSHEGEPDVPDRTLLINREHLLASPPDVLFLSLEMLNREMGNPDWSSTFGIGQGRFCPRLLLLDEVHAYEGLSGAQAAWVLRRWRHWSSARKLHIVGLSATLKNGPKHLEAVTGIPAHSTVEFSPTKDELSIEGMEYSLLVKGDPASGASLLATSIQCGMLITRLMVPRHVSSWSGDGHMRPDFFYGRKVFAFTDNLDGLNRWHSDVLDAEQNRRLAKLRLHPHYRSPRLELPAAELLQMDRQGQLWELPRKLGYNLNQPLMVSRCSSQDPGANAGSDLIVASSSLEVGYDDPDVGAILHHKKPTSLSSFIQRKGRAGRRRGMRPWTIIVLSDYGSDRWAFQQPERLFQPEIDSIFLPVMNPYVLRIQATFFLVDWLGRKVKKGGPFSYLKGPPCYREARETIRILEDFLEQGPEWSEFRRNFEAMFSFPFGRGGRHLTEMDLNAVLWNEPRPLLRAVVPTLLRKLKACFTLADPHKKDEIEDKGTKHPLPGFLPSATFAELGISEAILEFDKEGKEPESMGISRALFETCPGRVSKRFSVGVEETGYWHHFSEHLLENRPSASVNELFAQSLFLEHLGGVDIYQPQAIQLAQKPKKVIESSNAFWQWQSAFRPVGTGLKLPIFKDKSFEKIFRDSCGYLHRDQSALEIVRYARKCKFEIRQKKQDPVAGSLELQHTEDGKLVKQAVGFRQQVDGIALVINPECLEILPHINRDDEARLRTEYFLYLIKNSEKLSESLNPFLAEWLWQTSLAMLTATSLKNGCSIQDARSLLHGKRTQAATKVLDLIFQVRPVESDEDTNSRLKKKIVDLWSDSRILGYVEELEETLWTPPDSKYLEWLRHRIAATLAQAFRTTAISRLDEVSEDDLMIDLTWSENGTGYIYLSEMSAGGLGQIELVVRDLSENPHRFHEGFRHALAYCPRDDVNNNLIQAIECVVSEATSPLRTAFAQVRNARGFKALEATRHCLQAALEEAGLPGSRTTIVSVLTRLLGYGTSARTDRMIHILNKMIKRFGSRLGISIDPRVFAYLCVQSRFARNRVAKILEDIGGRTPETGQLYAILQRFLFADCKDSCPECLDQPNRFNDFGRPSRELTRLWLGQEIQSVSADSDDWVQLALTALQVKGRVEIVAAIPRVVQVARTLQALLARELELDYLLVPICITGVRRNRAEWRITLELKESDVH